MKEKIAEIKEQAIKKLEEINDLQMLNELKTKYLGKKGELTAILREMGNLSADEKPKMGSLVNEVRNLLEDKIKEVEIHLQEKHLNEKLEKERIDITLPSTKVKRGSKHPTNRVIEEIEDLFVSMGYDVVSGPELESDLYNFELLNLPKGHPARDMQDSFYITEDKLLRTHTSPMQVRTMLKNEEKTPIRIICPGKTYRRDDDATHSHQFSQVEGLVIDKKERHVSLADLKGTLEVLAKKVIGPDSKLRFRPSYFPFTEPSYEVDVSCFKCVGKGCNVCKKTGWLEVFAAGMVHPNVLKMCGYDPEVYAGFAFGPGLDRITMFKYGIPDIRILYTNDIRFLTQFDRKEID